ncbi:hypothetical protein THAOC_29865 [Thalassiosira oceanica]|uniref:Uncharacterized protein n=1 Tax=Thalassiosira oceanica TaxID=159749 RepID=K0RCT4_THAOC|nr:hypothetical protein THAOC_29865 [Thalassiosira oceanica]|eukprot:EJK51010.1 hypothetical protein THAOC_29865 [Thalassiosira oceanica]
MAVAWSTVHAPLDAFPPQMEIGDINALLVLVARLKTEISANKREITQLRESLLSAESDNLGLRQNKRGRVSLKTAALTQADLTIRDKLWDFIADIVWPHNKELTAGDIQYTPDDANSLCGMILKEVGDLPVSNEEHYYMVKIASMANAKMINLRSNAPKKLITVHEWFVDNGIEVASADDVAEGVLQFFDHSTMSDSELYDMTNIDEVYEQLKPVLHFVRYGHALYGKTLVNKWLNENRGRNLLDFLTDSDIEFVVTTVQNFKGRWLWEHTPESERDDTKPRLNFGDEVGKAAFGMMRINETGRTFGSKARTNWHTLRSSTFWPVMRKLWLKYSAEYKFACHFEERSSARLFSTSESEGGGG